jgi:hypothetical protein
MRAADLGRGLVAHGGGLYHLAAVPSPHPAFESYLVQIGPNTGLCFVKAIGVTIPTSAFGTQLRAEFSKLREELSRMYGSHRETDGLRAGSLWNEPHDWTMGLLKKDRLLAATWDGTTGARLSSELRVVYLTTTASAPDSGWLSLEYYFDNEEQCERELDRETAAP